MTSKLFASALLLTLATPALAQDDPYLSAHDSMSQQQWSTQQTAIGNHMVRESVRRNQARRHGGTRRATAQQASACAHKASFRQRYGAGDPKVRRLYSLCRGVGL